jgi:hypothetical protein
VETYAAELASVTSQTRATLHELDARYAQLLQHPTVKQSGM